MKTITCPKEIITIPLVQFRQELAKIKRQVQLHHRVAAATHYGETIGFLVPLALVAKMELEGKTIKSEDTSLISFRSDLLENWERLQSELDCFYLLFHRRRVVAFVSPKMGEMMGFKRVGG